MTAANPHLRAILIVGALAATAVALGMYTLARQQPGTATPAAIAPRHAAAKPGVAAPRVDPFVKAALAAGLPKAVARQFGTHEVVVVALYSRASSVDRLAAGEAEAGAALSGAGFVAVDASRDGASGGLTRVFGILSAPATLVLARGDFGKPSTTLNGFADRETVAQAAANADPTPGAPSAWARRAETLCERATSRPATVAARLALIAPPAGRAADVRRLVALVERQAALAKQLAAAKDPVAVATATAQGTTVGAHADTLAASLGAPACSDLG